MDGVALTFPSSTRLWALLPISHQRDMGGSSALVPNLHSLPMADIANRSQNFFCRASWDPDISSQVPRQVSWRAAECSLQLSQLIHFIPGALRSWKSKVKVETHRVLAFFPLSSVALSGACLREKLSLTLSHVSIPAPTLQNSD